MRIHSLTQLVRISSRLGLSAPSGETPNYRTAKRENTATRAIVLFGLPPLAPPMSWIVVVGLDPSDRVTVLKEFDAALLGSEVGSGVAVYI